MKRWLLDTGPIVAYLDESDPYHHEVADRLDTFTGNLHTTDAVIIETMHFLSNASNGPTLFLDFLYASRTEIHTYTTASSIAKAVKLMSKYADLPMDFADATLVLLAESLRLNQIITLDKRGFKTYRIRSKGRFQLVLDPAD